MKIYITGGNDLKIKEELTKHGIEVVDSTKGMIAMIKGTPHHLERCGFITAVPDIIYVSPKSNIDLIAKLCHETNAAYCRSMGDISQKSWADAEEWQKQSARNGVIMHLLNPGASPSASHESWMKEKLDDGWVHGDVKDAEAKTHPCIVDYDQLPKEQQAKDYIFKAIVNTQSGLHFAGLDLDLI
ncbi:MAG: RyR domain-containing protein [Shewanella sp.]